MRNFGMGIVALAIMCGAAVVLTIAGEWLSRTFPQDYLWLGTGVVIGFVIGWVLREMQQQRADERQQVEKWAEGEQRARQEGAALNPPAP